MATRTITGTFHHVDGSVWVGAEVRFEMTIGTYTTSPAITYPRDIQAATTDDTGVMTITLTSGLGIYWICHLPDGDAFRFALNNGSATTLESLRAEALGAPEAVGYPTSTFVITAPSEGQILRHDGVNFVNVGRFVEPIEPDYQNDPFDVRLGIDRTFTSASPGNNFLFAIQAHSTGTRNTVAVFGQGVADGAGSKTWGGNFVAYANHATANDVIGLEVNYGKQIPGSGGAYGVVIAASSPAGAGNNPTTHIQMQSNRDDAVPEHGIIFLNREGTGGGDVASSALITVGGTPAPTTEFGIDFADAEFTGSAFAMPNNPKLRALRTDVADTHIFLNFDDNDDVIINSSSLDTFDGYDSGVGIIIGTGRTFRINNTADVRRLEYDAATDRFTVTAPLDVVGEFTLTDGVTAPSATVGKAKIYVDSSGGDLKIVFGDGTVKTIVVDT